MLGTRIIGYFKRYTGILAVYCAIALTVLDGTIMNVALPALTRVFDASESAVIWVVNSYQLMITMLLLSFASLGDIYGYRRIFLSGIALFTGSSLLCALSPNLPMLIACRILQGIGAAAIMSVNIALVRMIYPADKLGRGIGINAIVVALSSVAGPTLAGFILSVASWHWLFLINLPIGIAAFAIGIRYLPANPMSDKPRKFDKISAVQCAVVMALFITMLDRLPNAANWHWTALQAIILVAIGFFFVRRQLHIDTPLLPVDLLRVPMFTLSVITSMAAFCAQMLALVAIPFLLHDRMGYDAGLIGLLISPWSVGVMIMAPIAGRLVERIHGGTLGAVGMCLFASGLLLLYLMPLYSGPWQIVWRMALCGIGYALFQTPNNVTMAQSSPMHRSGAAGGMQGAARTTGQTLGTTLTAIIFAAMTNGDPSRVCLLIAMAIALCAAVVSGVRLGVKRPATKLSR